MAWGIGQTFGPYLFSQIVEASSFTVMFFVGAAIFLITAFGFWKLRRVS
jgi:hypothetical protein